MIADSREPDGRPLVGMVTGGLLALPIWAAILVALAF